MMATCDFCAHRCSLKPGQTGRCGVRRATEAGEIETTVFGAVLAAAVDPVEKKPLHHFLPGSFAFSIALGGCNFRCRFCQNAAIAIPDTMPPARYQWSVADAVAQWKVSGAASIAFTYTEPAVWQDYMIAVARGVRAAGGRTIMVTNGFLTPEAIERLVPVIDAFNIDLKGDDAFYRTLCRATQQPVLDAIELLVPRAHVEVTSMIMESQHSGDRIEELYQLLAARGVRIWHLSRFHPAHRMRSEPATAEETLANAIDHVSGREIPFIFAGNSRQSKYQMSHCPHCGTFCVGRGRDETVHGACPSCGYRLYGVFE
jgi:pyruvate formate lyase activating enzyme